MFDNEEGNGGEIMGGNGSGATEADYSLLPQSFVEQIQVLSVRYGDIVKLSASSHYGEGSPCARRLGLYRKQDGTTRVALSFNAEKVAGTFAESSYRIEALCGEKKPGSKVHYGDTVRLVDNFGMVWNSSKGGGMRSGYIIPSKVGEPGEILVAFAKNGKTGMEVLYNEPGVFIDMIKIDSCLALSHTRLKNFKTPTSKCLSGYACYGKRGYDRRGFDMAISIYRGS